MILKKMMVLAVAAMVSSAFFGGCGDSVESICQKQCDCGKCSEKKLNDCINEGNLEQQEAEKNGCGDDFDELVSCAGGASCKGDELDTKVCEKLADRVEHCAEGKGDTATGGEDP